MEVFLYEYRYMHKTEHLVKIGQKYRHCKLRPKYVLFLPVT